MYEQIKIFDTSIQKDLEKVKNYSEYLRSDGIYYDSEDEPSEPSEYELKHQQNAARFSLTCARSKKKLVRIKIQKMDVEGVTFTKDYEESSSWLY